MDLRAIFAPSRRLTTQPVVCTPRLRGWRVFNPPHSLYPPLIHSVCQGYPFRQTCHSNQHRWQPSGFMDDILLFLYKDLRHRAVLDLFQAIQNGTSALSREILAGIWVSLPSLMAPGKAPRSWSWSKLFLPISNHYLALILLEHL